MRSSLYVGSRPGNLPIYRLGDISDTAGASDVGTLSDLALIDESICMCNQSRAPLGNNRESPAGLLNVSTGRLALRKMVDVFWNERKSQEAENHIHKIIELDPNDAEAHFRLYATLREQNRVSEALLHCRKAVEIEADFFEARLSLGLALLETGELEESAQHLREAVRLEPESAFANFNCGAALHRLGKPGDALGYYERAVQFNPELLPALLGIASIRLMIDQPALFDADKALAAAKQAYQDFANP